MAEFDVDLFVIGGGSGGVRAARIAAGHGARVMIAEEYRMGGTCVIRGCVPKKLLVYASHIHHEIEDAAWLRLDHSLRDLRLADLDCQQGQGNCAPGSGLHLQCGEVRCPRRQDPRGVRGRAHGAAGDRRGGKGQICADRNRRRTQSWHGYSRHRTRHLLQRSVSSAATSEANRDPGRRLYCVGICLHFCRVSAPT